MVFWRIVSIFVKIPIQRECLPECRVKIPFCLCATHADSLLLTIDDNLARILLQLANDNTKFNE